MSTNDVIKLLKGRGKRITKTRSAIIEIILNSPQPLTAINVKQYLDTVGINVNKTTVYRELEFLKKEAIVQEVLIKRQILHYESAFLPHHHHATCRSCGLVREVKNSGIEDEIEKLIDELGRSGFVIDDHKVEFSGVCASCK